MMRIKLMRWMNKHVKLSLTILLVIGFSLHLLYEYVHWPKPFMALIVFAGAGIAGWAIDLLFTKNEKDAGELD